MISTETSDDFTSACSSSSEEVARFKSGCGDGPTKKIRSIGKSTRISSIRSEKRCVKKTKKIILNGGINSAGKSCVKGENFLTKIPRPLSGQNEKKYLLYKTELLKDTNLLTKPFEFLCGAQKNFNKRKSLSQMDIQHLRNIAKHTRDLIPQNYSKKPIKMSDDEQIADRSLALNEEFYTYIKDSDKNEIDSRTAGMKIFATIMLNAWRKRRDDVKRLTEESSRARKSAIKVKTQIHVLNSLFKIEQKQNDELNVRLRRIVEEQRKTQDLYDDLNLSYSELIKSNKTFHEKLSAKESELDSLELDLDGFKKQIIQLVAQGKEYENEVFCLQKKCQELENKKNELLTNITVMKDELNAKEIIFSECIGKKDEEIKIFKEQKKILDKKLLDLINIETELQAYKNLNCIQNDEITELYNEVAKLNKKIDLYLPNRIKDIWMSSQIPQNTLDLIHFVCFYLLPAMPPPRIKRLPQFLSMNKTLRFLRRFI